MPPSGGARTRKVWVRLWRSPTWPIGFLEEVMLIAVLREEWAKLSQD